MSKTNLLALLLLSGCSSADFTNVHHVAAGGAPSAGKYPYDDSVSGVPSGVGGRSAAGGTMQAPASAGLPSVSNSGAGGIDLARAGSSSQAGAGNSGPAGNDAGKAGLSGAGGRLATDASSAGMRAATGGQGASGAPPAFAGMSGTSGGGEPIGGCNHQLLANADFEAGPGLPWQESSDRPTCN